MADGEYERPERRRAEIARLKRFLASRTCAPSAPASVLAAVQTDVRDAPAPLLVARGLVVGYAASSPVAVSDFEVRPGDFICVTGANGCGKTTLIKTLAGILPPLAGTLERAKIGSRACTPGYMPQQGPTQKDFPASVREVVQSGAQALRALRPFYSQTQRRRAARIMTRFGLADLASKCYRELSGGQRQRVLLARAFAAPHRLVLLDEPTAGLDADALAQLQILLGELVSKGVAIIMVTHETESVAALATHILRLGTPGVFVRKGAA